MGSAIPMLFILGALGLVCFVFCVSVGAYMANSGSRKAVSESGFDNASAKIQSVSPDGKTITTVDQFGNKKITTKNNDGTTDTITKDSSGKETSNSHNLIKDIVTNPLTWETMAAGLAWAAIIKISGRIETRIAGKATRTASKGATKSITRGLGGTILKVGEKISEKIMAKVGMRAATKASAAGGKMAAQAAAAGTTGPAAPFVEAAELAFNIFSGALDGLNLGGFKNCTNMSELNSFRDIVNSETKKAFESKGVIYPIIYGPMDVIEGAIDAISVINTKLTTDAIAKIQAGWKDGSRPKLPAGSKSEDYVKYFEDNIDYDALWDQAEAQWCTNNGGVMKKHPTSSNMICTWDTDEPGKCLAKWPVENGSTYYELNKKTGMCEVRPYLMREKCESLKLGVTYNFDTGSCNLTQEYCGRYGADQGLKNGDCGFSKGEQIAEMIFGTTIVRSLVNIFSEKNYKPCPPGAGPAHLVTGLIAASGALTGGLVIAAAGATGIYAAEKLMCQSDHCKDSEEKESGLCYDKCRSANEQEKRDGWGDYDSKADLLGTYVQGMCYSCKKGYHKSSAGLCQIKDPKTDIGEDAACPDGWHKTTAGMCEKDCTDTWKGKKYFAWGGKCYHPNVNKALLVKTPRKGPCDPGQRDDGTSCWGEVGHVGSCRISCSPVYGIKKNLFQRQSCDDGYELKAAMCYAVSRPGIQQSKSTIEIGVCKGERVCPAGMHKTKEGSTEFCEEDCKKTWTDANGKVLNYKNFGGKCYHPAADTKSLMKMPVRGKCTDGYNLIGNSYCMAISEPGGKRTPLSSTGSYLPGTRTEKILTRCFKRCDDTSWGGDPNFTRLSGTGTCRIATGLPTIPAKQYARKPNGISLRIFKKERIAPFPSTSESDFKNSTIGRHIQDGINAIRNGDPGGFGKSVAGLAITANPVVLALGASDLAEIGAEKAGLNVAERQQGTGGW